MFTTKQIERRFKMFMSKKNAVIEYPECDYCGKSITDFECVHFDAGSLFNNKFEMFFHISCLDEYVAENINYTEHYCDSTPCD